MKRPLRRWLIGIAAVLLLGTGALVWVASTRLPSDEEVAARIAEGFEKRFGVGLKIGGAHWALWPSPVLVLSDLATEQPRPVTLRRITVQLKLRELLRRVAIDEVEIESLVLPRESVRAIRGGSPKPKEDGRIVALPAPWTLAPVPLEKLRWRDLVWIDRRNMALAYDGEITFDAGWRPRQARIERAGASPPARLRLDRAAGQDRWRTRIDIGGGTANGVAWFETLPPNDLLRVSAELEPRQVDIEGMLQAFGRRSAVAGKASGQSMLVAEAEEVGALLRSLRTRTTFSVQPATLTRLDLAKAVTTAGISRGGTTPLDELTGVLDTQGTDDGVVMRYTGLKARSGVLTASGRLRLFNRKLDGEIAVDLIDGVVGMPLQIGGTMSEPEVSLTGGALAGAAVGTAVLPGVGTALGARAGQQLEKLFGAEEPVKKKPAPAARKGARASP